MVHNNSKLDARAKKYIFIVYAGYQKGYVLYDPASGRTSIHRDVQFHESSFGQRYSDSALADPPEPEHDADTDYEPPTTDDKSVTENHDDQIEVNTSLSKPL